MMSTKEAKEFLFKRHVPQLFESMLTGLMYHRPEDPISFLENCLIKTRQLGGPEGISWDTFIYTDKRPLAPIPPMTPGTSKPSRPGLMTPGTTMPSRQDLMAPGTSTPSRPGLMAPGTSTPSRPGLMAPGTTMPSRPDLMAPGTSTPSRPAPYRHYEKLPPIQPQVSIESDSDMTECSGLIQEYDIFDPSKPRPHIIFIIGGPGSGKGTQTAKLASCYRLESVSVGEILRKQLLNHASSDRKWEGIAEIISNGELAPQETTIEELKQHLIGQQGASGFIVDGFPRDISQAFTFEEQIGSPDLVVLLMCSNRTLRTRLERRAAEHGRLDDSNHAIEKRLETFKHNINPIAKYYHDRALLVRVDAGREEDDIFADVSAAVRERLFHSCPQDTPGVSEVSVEGSQSPLEEHPSLQ